nr:MAG TPA: hypothetical protein [Inoviridae sp.]
MHQTVALRCGNLVSRNCNYRLPHFLRKTLS